MSPPLQLSIALESSYRMTRPYDPQISRVSTKHLQTAGDSLSMALLTLGGEADVSDTTKFRRAEEARNLILEGANALSRARVYVRGIRTYSPAFVMATEMDPDAEHKRLQRLATRLLWFNHANLPARYRAKPLPPDEEAQLATLVQNIWTRARLDRMARHRWMTLSFATAASGVLVGAPLLALGGAALATAGVFMGLFRMALEGRAGLYAPPQV